MIAGIGSNKRPTVGCPDGLSLMRVKVWPMPFRTSHAASALTTPLNIGRTRFKTVSQQLLVLLILLGLRNSFAETAFGRDKKPLSKRRREEICQHLTKILQTHTLQTTEQEIYSCRTNCLWIFLFCCTATNIMLDMADILDTDENRPAAANSQFVELQRYKYLPINHFTCFTCSGLPKTPEE